MRKSILLIGLFLGLLLVLPVSAKKSAEKINAQAFELLDLDRPGLETVRALYKKGKLEKAATALLDYYRQRKGIVDPDIDLNKIEVSKTDQKWADDALEHTFYAHKGYQPSYNYGKDIDWKYWPVKDNELRWQLHRHQWFTPMGKVYRKTHDEKYAIEWKAEYLDWIKKNPLVEVTDAQFEMDDKENLAAAVENARFAWRPLEISHRIQDQIHQFVLFEDSPNFTPAFLTEFLVNYYKHGNYILHHYSKQGNHLLFESQRMFFAGTFFPEIKEAAQWKKTGIDNLNREIKKQVFADGVQYELDPSYHLACINIFLRALTIARANHNMNAIPQSYIATMEKMIEAYYNIYFPDYTIPCFSDSRLGAIHAELRSFREFAKVFPENETIKWFATQGKQGKCPSYLSKGLLNGGFFTFRNGWDKTSLVMVLKAGPKGEWHAQPDNGTFNIWFNGKNLFPDSGSYIYAGNEEVQKLRDWFRSTRQHNTLTLDDKNLESTVSHTLLWQPEGDVQTLVTENQSYKQLKHRRTVFFVDQKYFVLVDEASGDAKGRLGLNYLLTDGETTTDQVNGIIRTNYKPGSNVMIQCFGSQKVNLTQEEGAYSTFYRKKTARPHFIFSTDKNDAKTVRFVTVIYPDKEVGSVKTSAKIVNASDTEMKVEVNVNGHKKMLEWKL